MTKHLFQWIANVERCGFGRRLDERLECCLWSVENVFDFVLHLIGWRIETFRFQGVCVLCDEIVVQVVLRRCSTVVGTQARVARGRLHTVVGTRRTAHVVWQRSNNVATVNAKEKS